LGTLSEFLHAIHRRRLWGWIALIAYAAAVTFPHEQVQFIVNEIANRITHKRLYQVSAAILLVQGALLTWFLFRRVARHTERRALTAFWVLTIFLIWCAWRFFTANNVELVHYPQYIPEGMALLALTFSPAESLAWIALFGGLDEGFQYSALKGATLYDFNDIFMDLLGGAAGIVFAMVFLRWERAPTSWKSILLRPGVVAILTLVAIGILLWSGGWMVLYRDASPNHWFSLSHVKMPAFWFQVPANGPNRYHTLSPIEGPILILATIGLYATLDRRLRIARES
jgi:glycopeptide antibiotics resistance protein